MKYTVLSAVAALVLMASLPLRAATYNYDVAAVLTGPASVAAYGTATYQVPISCSRLHSWPGSSSRTRVRRCP